MAKKFNLREFQTNLSRQLQAATTRETAFSRLGFQVGNGNWLVALDHAEEVIPVPTIIPVPGTQRTLGLKNASIYRDQDEAPEKPWVARKYKDASDDEWIDLNFPALLNDAEFMKVEAHA